MDGISRRDLLSGAAAAGAVAAMGMPGWSSSVWADNADNKMQFGLVTYLWGKDMDLPALLDACEKSGLSGVELRTQHAHRVEPSLSKEQRLEVRKRFADSPVTLVGYGSNCQFHENDPAKLQRNIEQAKTYVDLMQDCGGSGLKVKPNGFVSGVPREKTIEQIGNALNEVAVYGAERGQEIRVEVHGRGTIELPVIRDIFEVADHSNVGVCWNCNNEDLAGDGLEANFNLVKDRFARTVHVREAGVGDYPYAQLMKHFVAMNYAGWILLEARTNPKDKIAALTEQRKIFENLVRES